MNKIAKLLIATIVVILGAVGLISFATKNHQKPELSIISTSFPGYDFARAVVKDAKGLEVKMLLKPGAETHDYEPTPQDIKDIKNSDIFIYVGGDSDEWIEDVLNDIDTDKTKIIKLMDLVKTVQEETVAGMEEDEDGDIEYDEHVWTSPINAIAIIKKLKDQLIKTDTKNSALYEKNTADYIDELTKIDAEIRDTVKNAARTEIIFGDRFPLRYFVDEYGLSYYAAFPGCSEQTEASAKTISFLIDKVKTDKIPVVFHIELSNGKIAETIAEETGAKVLEFHSAHNISQEDFDSGLTYADIMKNNITVLKEALD